MLDKQDLQAIKELIDTSVNSAVAASEERTRSEIQSSEERMKSYMDSSVTASEERMKSYIDSSVAASEERTRAEIRSTEDRLDKKFDRMRGELMQDVTALMESEFRPQFNLLAENQQLILEKLAPLDEIELLDARVTTLEVMVKKLGREVAELKKAQ